MVPEKWKVKKLNMKAIKEKVINLDEYLEFGGKLENLDLSITEVTFDYIGRNKQIVSIKKSRKNKFNETIFLVKFFDNNVEEYIGEFIETTVILNISLDKKYL
jgi:hypothetical protein